MGCTQSDVISHLCLGSLWLLCRKRAEEGSREAREGNAGSSISLFFFSPKERDRSEDGAPGVFDRLPGTGNFGWSGGFSLTGLEQL